MRRPCSSTSSGKAKCSTRATRSLRSGDRFWAATSLYLISGVSNATCRRRRGRGVMLAHHRNRSGRQTMKVVEHYQSAIESSDEHLLKLRCAALSLLFGSSKCKTTGHCDLSSKRTLSDAEKET